MTRVAGRALSIFVVAEGKTCMDEPIYMFPCCRVEKSVLRMMPSFLPFAPIHYYRCYSSSCHLAFEA